MRIHNRFVIYIFAFLLAFATQIFGSGPAPLYAPQMAGDGQTASWRIINQDEAGKNPWAAIGNFLIPGLGGYCSAVLVAPRIVLTANHCLYANDYRTEVGRSDAARQLMDPKQFVFVAGLHDNFFVDLIPVESVITGGWEPGSEDTSKDWLIAVLARPASSDIVPIAIRPYRPELVTSAWRDRLVLAGYPAATFAFSAVLRLSIHCSILKSDSVNIVSHDCPAEGGSSGAPILVEEDGELRVIGIHSNTQRGGLRREYGVSVNSFLASFKDARARYN